jgi:hypothetical protein
MIEIWQAVVVNSVVLFVLPSTKDLFHCSKMAGVARNKKWPGILRVAHLCLRFNVSLHASAAAPTFVLF